MVVSAKLARKRSMSCDVLEEDLSVSVVSISSSIILVREDARDRAG